MPFEFISFNSAAICGKLNDNPDEGICQIYAKFIQFFFCLFFIGISHKNLD